MLHGQTGPDPTLYRDYKLLIFERECSGKSCVAYSDSYVDGEPYCADCIENMYEEAIHLIIETMGGDSSYYSFDVVNDYNETLRAVTLNAEILGMDQELKFPLKRLKYFQKVCESKSRG